MKIGSAAWQLKPRPKWPHSTDQNAWRLKASLVNAAARGFFCDSQTPVSAVFENLEASATVSEVMEWFHVSHDQVAAVLKFAARSLDTPSAMLVLSSLDVHPVRQRYARATLRAMSLSKRSSEAGTSL